MRDRLVVCTLEAIIKSSENFPGYFEVNERLTHLHGKARKTNFEKFENSEAVDAVTDFFLVNCNQLESCKGLCLRFVAKGGG